MSNETTDLLDSCKILYSPQQVDGAIMKLGKELCPNIKDPGNTVLLAILNGGMWFAIKLSEWLDERIILDTCAYSSYRQDDREGRWLKWPTVDLHGKDVILVDDIFDTGNTMENATRLVKTSNPRNIITCTLLWKPGASEDRPEFFALTIGDEWVFGSGMDLNEQYRGLGGVWVAPEGSV